MLLDPLEEQFGFPTAAIKLGDSSCWQIGVVCQEGLCLALGILETNAPQRCRIAHQRVETCQRPDLIANDAFGSIRFPGIAAREAQIRFGVDDKETASQMPSMQLIEIDVAPIHDVHGTCLWQQHVENIDFVPLAIADVDDIWDVAAKVVQRVRFHRGFGAAKRRPRRHREAQVDSSRIQGIDCVCRIDSESLLDIRLPRNADQVLSEVGIDGPVANTVGVCQGLRGYRAAKPHVVKLVCLTSQAGLNVAQALAVGQLREGRSQILIQADEMLDRVLPIVANDAATESGQRKMCHNRRKDEFFRIHEHAPQSGWKNRKCYVRRSNRDQHRTRNILFPSTCYITPA